MLVTYNDVSLVVSESTSRAEVYVALKQFFPCVELFGFTMVDSHGTEW